ncbi:MAG: hypothetical protein HDT35_06090 [Clostridiales bacterium]|nr:hypothetical protein [Clostridiales bacterium]
MDPRKAAAEWLYNTVFKEEAIRPRAPKPAERVPQVIRAARSLETGIHQSWQSRESLFMKQGKLLAGYEDDYEYGGGVQCYYPTYQSLTDRQLRGYFSWRTKLRRGDVREAPLSFAFLYIYELINQIGVVDPMDGYRRLARFRDAYGQIDSHILSYLNRWLSDYVIYYGLDRELLSDTPQAVRERSVAVLERVQERDAAGIMDAVKGLSGWLERSKFYGAYRDDMDTVIVRVLRRVSAHYAARCKKTMAEQYFGSYSQCQVSLFDTAVFCDPLKRRSYEYAVDERWVYSCKNGLWFAQRRAAPPGSGGKLDDLLKTIDSVMRQEFDYGHPVKSKTETKWLLRLIQEEAQKRLAEKKAAEERKITIDYGRLTKIRQDAAMTQEKLIVDEEMDIPEGPVPREPAPREQEPEQLSLLTPAQAEPAPAAPPAAQGGDTPLSPLEYRLLQCLLYGGDTGWVQAEGHLLSVLVDGVNEKLYDTFLDTVIDDGPQLIDDYIDDLKEMVRP